MQLKTEVNALRKKIRKNKILYGVRKKYVDTRTKIIGTTLKNRENRKIAIIGCGRSGTKYVSELFSSLGVKIGHECIKKNGIASWTIVPDTSIELWGPSYKTVCDFKMPYVHQVRDPLKVISSVCTVFSDPITWNFIERFIPVGKNDKTILKAMKYWYYWNLIAEEKAIFTYKVEEIEDILPRLLEIGGFEKELIKAKKSELVSKKVNSRTHGNLDWADLGKYDSVLSNNIKLLSNKYGY